MMRRFVLALPMLFGAAACSDGAEQTAVTVSVIGPRPAIADPDRGPVPASSAVLMGAVAQGLVRLDGQGRIEPGLAERWIVTDDGLSLIFRIKRTQWADGQDVTGEQVADDLRRLLAGRSRIAPSFSGIGRVSAMTGRVVEIRLSTPQPRLLELLAQPEAAVTRRTIGTGPLRLVSSRGAVFRLQRMSVAGEGGAVPRDAASVRGDDAARAVTRFRFGTMLIVTNGRFSDLPLARAARIQRNRMRFDPANGLFGLIATGRTPALDAPGLRSALSMAVDRDRLIGLFGVDGWKQAISVVPTQFDLPAPPAAQDWVPMAKDDRISRASGLLAAWRAKHGDVPVLRIWLPRGPGSDLLYAALAADWAKIGVTVDRAASPEGADFSLVDEVAPQQTALWYLSRVACRSGLVCPDGVRQALLAVRAAETAADRTARLSEADREVTLAGTFIPLATPMRWSLVAPTVAGWRDNAFATHPLEELTAVAP